MAAAVEMKNWSVRYSTGNAVLENCSFTLEQGDFAVLSGLSGEGKSTLLSSINGIIPNVINAEVEGEILIEGDSIADKKMTSISHLVGSVLQNPDSQIFHSVVDDEIAFGCENLNMPPEEISRRIEESASLFNLDKEARTRTLSGGQKQRLMTSCVYAMGQKILLLDEPCANLDAKSALHLLRILRDLCSKDYAVLLVEHRIDLVLPYVDRVFVLENKKIVEKKREDVGFAGMRKIPDTSQASKESEIMISAKQLAYEVKTKNILRDITFEVRKGERVVVLGENGCGKTTLLQLLAGLIKQTDGNVDIDIPFRRGSRKWFGPVGYVYQEPSYQLFMPSVEEEVHRNATQEMGDRCMRDFSLEKFAQQHPQSLSEGQKRRVSIAAVMAAMPQLLLLDEPTVGQDFDNLHAMVDALNTLHMETGNTMITITHDYRCAEALADRVIWIKDGVIVRDGGKELVAEYYDRQSRIKE